ncbi:MULTISPECIES: hypothetical protein [unclassified Arsukibacterium]|uniref:hypothetical protein n=1 Tax=unclassified Arsukibacterium TaxID=2635278 RepID=UPI000C8AD046|nr:MULTISPECIES: hypothetical protein [unclassified Arsukibacterium]MAA95468.1 hypothetical protein [Rheinheimera sp.]HAW94369.1 hypothetical protein [Candidatus Azambacteria bacterium]|tara:strand:+ start:33658 stop:34815 length:1158 start_codon:yes stop_codon:yes gene_type:complete
MKKWVLVIAAALLVFIIWIFSRGQWQQVTEENGLSRQAVSQPWFASTQLLQQQQRSFADIADAAELRQLLKSGRPSEQMIVINENLLRFEPDLAEPLLAWTRSGGHLVYQLSAENRKQIANNSLVAAFDIEISLSQSDVQHYWHRLVRSTFVEATAEFQHGVLKVAIMPDSRIDHCFNPLMTIIEDDEEQQEVFVACQFASDQGKITFTSQTVFMQNTLLDKADNALLTLSLVGNASQLHVMRDPGTLLWFQRLWYWNWPAWTLLLLTFFLLIWRFAQRLSPPERLLTTRDNVFEHHLYASGNFLNQRMPADWLKQQLMQDIQNICDRRYPGFSRLTEHDQQQLIANWCGVSSQQLNHFLTQPWPVRAVDLAEYIGFWQKIRKAI